MIGKKQSKKFFYIITVATTWLFVRNNVQSNSTWIDISNIIIAKLSMFKISKAFVATNRHLVNVASHVFRRILFHIRHDAILI